MKRPVTSFLEGAVLFVGLSLVTARTAHAYLDPGTGSYSFQVGMAGIFGALFSVKLFWGNIKDFARRITPDRSSARDARRQKIDG